MEKPSRRARARKEEPTQNSLVREDVPALLTKWVDVGQTKLPSSCVPLAWAKAQSVPESTQTQVAHAWNQRWRKILACTAAKSFANTLLEHARPTVAGGTTPFEADVMRDCAHEW